MEIMLSGSIDAARSAKLIEMISSLDITNENKVKDLGLKLFKRYRDLVITGSNSNLPAIANDYLSILALGGNGTNSSFREIQQKLGKKISAGLLVELILILGKEIHPTMHPIIEEKIDQSIDASSRHKAELLDPIEP